MTDRFGIAEWFGHPVDTASAGRKAELAAAATSGLSPLPLPCPFASAEGTLCSKTTGPGVCSVRRYAVDDAGKVSRVTGSDGHLRATCDRRIRAGGSIYAWVADVMLSDSQAFVLPEIPFMTSTVTGRAAGKIDNVLVTRRQGRLDWCALEVQSVYVQGSSYAKEFEAIRVSGAAAPVPVSGFRPDYRSSSAKRLAPQLELKVPTLRRWGRKMAVAVDEAFFDNMDAMKEVDAVADCDVAWFIVGFDDDVHGDSHLVRRKAVFTTLEETRRGLIAADVVTKQEFEGLLISKTDSLRAGG